jgi:hypothetical protein
MPAKFGAGRMSESVAFDKRQELDDGFGNTIAGDWREQFRHPAEFIFQRGSETVMAARLQNRAPMIVRVRMCSATRAVGTDWRLRDVRRGKEYNIRDINQESRAYLDMLVESNVNPRWRRSSAAPSYSAQSGC